MRKFVLPLLLLFTISLKAQYPVPKFGDVDINDLKMASYEKDTSADALILFDDGSTTFTLDNDRQFVFNYERHLRIKIFKKAAFDAANFTIRLYNRGLSRELLGAFKATTYNIVNGKVVKSKLDISKTFENTGKTYIEKKLAFPEVKEGSIIELSYSIQSDLLYNLRGWNFQYQYPARLSQFSTSIPEYFKYRRNSKGYLAFDISTEKQLQRTYVLHYSAEIEPGLNGGRSSSGTENIKANTFENVMAIKDVPAFKPEPDIDCVDNYKQSIAYELMSIQMPGKQWQNYTPSWEDVTKRLYGDEDFGNLLKNTRLVSDTVNAICKDAASPIEKAMIIYSYMQRHMNWDGDYRLWATNGLKKPFAERAGSSAEINLLLTLMLQSAGIKALPAIISTRDNGIILGVYPSITDFNSVIVSADIDGKNFLLDATSKYCPFGILPPNDLNGTGRVINSDQGYGIDLKSPVRFIESKNYCLAIGTDGVLKGSLIELFDGYAGVNKRINLKSEKSTDDYFRKMQENTRGLTITKSALADLNNIYKPFSDTLQLEINNHIDIVGDKMMFYPLLFERYEKNRYSLEERKYPVNYTYPISKTYVFSYTIPDGYVVESLPKSIVVKFPDNSATFSYSVQNLGNSINVIFVQNITKIIYLPEEYQNLKAFYDQIVRKNEEQVILKKSS